MRYQFDEFEVDTDKFALSRNGKACPVEPLVFDLIAFLSRNSGRVITRDEVIDHVWNGRVVSDATVASCIKSARKVLGDSGGEQKYIRTIRGRGIQFLGSVQLGNLDDQASNDTSFVELPLRPSLAIIPFQVFGDDAALNPIADGLVESLTTILTRVPLLSIPSRSSMFALKGEAVDAQKIGRRFNVRYVVEGSLQSVQDQLRANVQLIETQNGFQLWAQQFDHPNHDVDVQEALLHDILPLLETQIVRTIHNELRTGTGELSSDQLLLQAMGLLALKGWHQNTFIEAAELLRRSLEQEPANALSHAYRALILGLGHRVGLMERSKAVVENAIEEAEIALDLDDMNSNVVGLAACALADVGQADRAVPLLKKALDLNPNNGQAWTALGSAYAILGRAADAIEPLERGIRVSPMDSRLAVWRSVLALVYLETGNAEQAEMVAQEGCQSDDKTYLPRVALTAVRLARKQTDEAASALRDCLRVKPDLSRQEVDCLIGPQLGAAFAKLKAAAT